MDDLYPYQVEGAASLLRAPRRGLFDWPGLGKTAQAIRACESAGARRVLVVCPAGVRAVWPAEVARWSRTGLRARRMVSAATAKHWQREDFEILVCSFEQAVGNAELLRSDFFDCLIVDEAHYLQNIDAKRTRAILGPLADGAGGIAGMADRGFLLTGTPIKGDPAGVWPLLRFLGGTSLGNVAFQRRYFAQQFGTYSVKNTLRKDLVPELRAVMESVALQRSLDDVGLQLPPGRIDSLPVDGNDREVVAFLRSVPGLEDRILRTLRSEGRLAFDDAQHVSALRMLIGQAKSPVYAKMLLDELAGTDTQHVVMAHHRGAVDRVCDTLSHGGVSVVAVHGGTSAAARDAAVRDFQAGRVQVFVGNITAAGTGLTLTASARLDMLESSWTPADNVQAIQRIRRIGQKLPTVVRFVTLLRSFDERVNQVVAHKANQILSLTGQTAIMESTI